MSHTLLSDLKVIEFTHMIMGPAVGLMLADLGADVIKVEPVGGDKTRKLRGAGAGYFPMFNRNKRSICLNIKTESGAKIARELIAEADVFIENMRPGAMDKLGFGYADLQRINPKLIYCSEKGFLNGPYSNRTALDEVAQMMGGLAYMTGPVGRPLRAGASVIDVTGGMFGAIGVLSALHEREKTGRGKHVTAALFETTAFLVGQHMAQFAVTGTPAPPMPARVSAWAIYDSFKTSDDELLFVGVVSDTQWRIFCKAFGFEDWLADDELAENRDRVLRRDVIIPRVQEAFRGYRKDELMATLEPLGLPFAPVSKPEELFDDPHLNAAGGLHELTLSDGAHTKLPALPVQFDEDRLALRSSPPRAGENTSEILNGLGYDEDEVRRLVADECVALATQ